MILVNLNVVSCLHQFLYFFIPYLPHTGIPHIATCSASRAVLPSGRYVGEIDLVGEGGNQSVATFCVPDGTPLKS